MWNGFCYRTTNRTAAGFGPFAPGYMLRHGALYHYQ